MKIIDVKSGGVKGLQKTTLFIVIKGIYGSIIQLIVSILIYNSFGYDVVIFCNISPCTSFLLQRKKLVDLKSRQN